MEKSKSRSLTDVSKLQKLTKRGRVRVLHPRDLSEALSPKGQQWLPPETPDQEGPSREFTPRFQLRKTTKKSRIPTLKGSSKPSEKRHPKSRPSSTAAQKRNQDLTASSGSDSDEGFATMAHMRSRPRSAPTRTKYEKRSLIPKLVLTSKRPTSRKPEGKQKAKSNSAGKENALSDSSGEEADVSRESADADSNEQRAVASGSAAIAGEQGTSPTRKSNQGISPMGENSGGNIRSVSSNTRHDMQSTSPANDEQHTSPPIGDNETASLPAGEGDEDNVDPVLFPTGFDTQRLSPDPLISTLENVGEQRAVVSGSASSSGERDTSPTTKRDGGSSPIREKSGGKIRSVSSITRHDMQSISPSNDQQHTSPPIGDNEITLLPAGGGYEDNVDPVLSSTGFDPQRLSPDPLNSALESVGDQVMENHPESEEPFPQYLLDPSASSNSEEEVRTNSHISFEYETLTGSPLTSDLNPSSSQEPFATDPTFPRSSAKDEKVGEAGKNKSDKNLTVKFSPNEERSDLQQPSSDHVTAIAADEIKQVQKSDEDPSNIFPETPRISDTEELPDISFSVALSEDSSTSHELRESPFSSDVSLTFSSDSLESFAAEDTGVNEESNDDKLPVVKPSKQQGRSLKKGMSRSHHVLSLGSIERKKILSIRSCKSFFTLPHITPSHPRLSKSFRQLLHGCHSFRQMPHITDTESDLDFPTVSVMELVKVEDVASGMTKDLLHLNGSETSSEDEEPAKYGRQLSTEKVIDFWNRSSRPRSYTAPADFYSEGSQSRSYEVFPKCFLSRLRFDQSLEKVSELPEFDEIKSKEKTDGGTCVLARSRYFHYGDNQEEQIKEHQEEVLCRWRKRKKPTPWKRSYSYSYGDKEHQFLKLGVKRNKIRKKPSSEKDERKTKSCEFETIVYDLETRLSEKEKEVEKLKKESFQNIKLSRKQSKEMKHCLDDLQDELSEAKEYILKLEERNNQQSKDIEEMRRAMIRGVTSMYNDEMKELWAAVEARQSNSYTYIADLENKLKQKESELELAKNAVPPETLAIITSADALVKQADMEMSLLKKNYEIDALEESLKEKDSEIQELQIKVNKMSQELKRDESSQNRFLRKKLERQVKDMKMKDMQIRELENALKEDLSQRYKEASEMIESAKINLITAHDLDQARKATEKQTEEEVICVEEAIKKFAKQKEREVKELKAELEEVKEKNYILESKNETDELQYFTEIETRVEMEMEIKELHLCLREMRDCLKCAVEGKYGEARTRWEVSGTTKSKFKEFHKLIEDRLKERREESQNLLEEKEKVLELQKEKVKITGEKYEDIKAMERQTNILLALKEQEVHQLKQENLQLIRRQEEYIDCLKKSFNENLQKRQRTFEEFETSADKLAKKKEEQTVNLEEQRRTPLRSKDATVRDDHRLCEEKLKEKEVEIQRLKNYNDEVLRQVETKTRWLESEMVKVLSVKDIEIEDMKQFCHDIFQKTTNDVVEMGKSLSKEFFLKEEELEKLKVAHKDAMKRKDEEAKELRRMLHQLQVTKDSTIQELEKCCNNNLLLKDREIESLGMHSKAIIKAKNEELDENFKELIATRQSLEIYQKTLGCAHEEILCQENEMKKLRSQIEKKRQTQEELKMKQMALKKQVEEKELEIFELHEASVRASEAFANDYRSLLEKSNERHRDKDRRISLLEDQIKDVIHGKDLEMQHSLAALKEQIVLKDETIQFLNSSMKEADESLKKKATAVEREKDDLKLTIKTLENELCSRNFELQQELEQKALEVERLRKVCQDTMMQTDLQLEHRLKAENAVKDKEQEIRSYQKEMQEEKKNLLCTLHEKMEKTASLESILEQLSNDNMEISSKMAAAQERMENQNKKANNRIQALEKENCDYKEQIKLFNQQLKKGEQTIKMLQMSVQHLQANVNVRDKALQNYSRTLANEQRTRESLNDNSRRLSEQLTSCEGKIKELKQSVKCIEEEKRTTARNATKCEKELTEYRNTSERLKQENASLNMELLRLQHQSKEDKRQENHYKETLRDQTVELSAMRQRVDGLLTKLKESENVRKILDDKLRAKEREQQLVTKQDQKRITVELEEAVDRATKRASESVETTSDRLLAALHADEAVTKQLRSSLQIQENEINRLTESVNEQKKREDSSKDSARILTSHLKHKDEVIASQEETIQKLRDELQELTASSERKFSSDTRKISELKQDVATLKATLDHTLLNQATMGESQRSEREILNSHIKHLKNTIKKDEFLKKTLQEFSDSLENDKVSLSNQVAMLRDELREKETELIEVKRFAREAGFKNKMLIETIETYKASSNSLKREPV